MSEHVESVGPRLGLTRQDDAGVADDLREGRLVGADHRRAERHRLDHRCAESLVLAREDERICQRDETVAMRVGHTTGPHDARSEFETFDHRRDLVVDGSRPTEQHQPEVGIIPVAGHHLEQEHMALVRMGDRRKDEHSARSEPVGTTQLERRRCVDAECGFDTVGNDDDPVGRGSVRVDDRSSHVVGRHGDDRRPLDRARNRPRQVTELRGAQVLGVGEVLEIVDGEHDRSVSTDGCRSPTVVNELRGAGAATQPRVFGENPPRSTLAGDAGGDHRVQLCEFRVGIDERGEAVERRDELGRLRPQTDQLSREVLLGTSDVARNAPQQVDRHVDRRVPTDVPGTRLGDGGHGEFGHATTSR